MKKIFIPILAALLMVTTVTASAQEVGEGNTDVTINGEVTATVITVTVPTAMSFTINPNAEPSFVSSTADIVSKTAAKLDVDVLGFRSDTNNGTKVVAPDRVKWDELGVTETKRQIALGVKAAEETIWSPAEPAAAYDDASATAGTILVAPNGTVPISLDAKYGKAWISSDVLKYNLFLRISLSEGGGE